MNSRANAGALVDEICISIEQSSSDDDSYHTTENGGNLDSYRPLLDAAMNNDWESAKTFIESDQESVEDIPITECGRTALHIAAGAGHSQFVINLVDLMTIEALELQDRYDGNTALHLAVIAGLDEAVEVMVGKHGNLTRICNKKGLNPLLNAAIHIRVEHRDIIKFLCGVMKDDDSGSFQGHLGAHLICSITRAGIYELAYNLIREYPSLATAREKDGDTMLDVLAEMGSAIPRPYLYPSTVEMPFQPDIQRYEIIDKRIAFLKKLHSLTVPDYEVQRIKYLRSSIIPELRKIIFEQISLMTKKEMYHFFFKSNFPKTAAKTGSIEILKRCIKTYPDQLWFPHEGRNIFQIAVENRQEKTFDYLYDHMNADEKILTTRIVDSNGGNILHVAAKHVPSFRLNRNPVYQLQGEINWFKKVGKKVPPALAKMRNDQGETPQEVFTREHEDLMKKAETYMLRTAESCLIVAALVATVAFAGAITVPGGNFSDSDKTNKGKPIFLGKRSFLAFMVADALALFSSTYAIQLFLLLFVGNYNVEATFEKLMPLRLKHGLVSLRMSVVSVIIAFSIVLSVILGGRYAWAPYLIGVAAVCSCGSSLIYVLVVIWRSMFKKT